jgi:hypothetical protein
MLPRSGGDAPTGGARCSHSLTEMLPWAPGGASTAGRRCFHGPAKMLPRAAGAVSTAWRRCSHERRVVLPRPFGAAPTGDGRCSHGQPTMLPPSVGGAPMGGPRSSIVRWWRCAGDAANVRRRSYLRCAVLLHKAADVAARVDGGAAAPATSRRGSPTTEEQHRHCQHRLHAASPSWSTVPVLEAYCCSASGSPTSAPPACCKSTAGRRRLRVASPLSGVAACATRGATVLR